MGLAATQARLLTITSRKADCEFQSMTLSHQKLSLSRDMEAISDQYQNALNATKLIYDYQGMQSKEMGLTYDLLMTPSIYNDYYPKLVTDSKNRIILNSVYAQAARAAGIPAEGLLGTPSSDVRNKFIAALAGNNVITPAMSAQIQASTYRNGIGLGDNSISATAGYDELTYEELLNRIKVSTESTNDYGLKIGTYKTKYSPVHGGDNSYSNLWVDGTIVQSAQDADGNTPGYAISLDALLNGNIDITWETLKGELTPVFEAAYLQQVLVGTDDGEHPGFINWLFDQFYTVLGGTSMSNAALQFAYNEVFDLLSPDNSLQRLEEEMHKHEGGDLDEYSQYTWELGGLDTSAIMESIGVRLGSSGDNSAKYTDNYLGFVYDAKYEKESWHDDGHDRTVVGISLSNLTKAFLTSYVQYMQGGPDASKYYWSKGALSNSTFYDPSKDDFTFIVRGDSVINSGDSDVYAGFYDTLFNQICTSGWVENDKIDNADYMSEMFKNGMAYISSMSDDGYYYQSSYSTEKNIREVTDDEAIAQAEAKYNAEKARIENKEQTLDLKMKNLDTEINSLSQEYEAAKNLINKAIEKSFKRYDA